MWVVEDLCADGEAVRGGDWVVDVAGLDGDEGVEEFGGSGEAVGPALAGGGVEDGAVVVEGFGEGDGVEDGDALPGAEGDVVDPTAVGAGDLLLGPLVDEEGGFEVFGLAGGVGLAEEWVNCVSAAAVDDGAGGAEEGSAECGVGVGGLVGEETVAPGLEEDGVEVFLWGGLCGLGECGKGEDGCCGGGELQHFATGQGEFWHRGNLRRGCSCRWSAGAGLNGNWLDGRGGCADDGAPGLILQNQILMRNLCARSKDFQVALWPSLLLCSLPVSRFLPSSRLAQRISERC